MDNPLRVRCNSERSDYIEFRAGPPGLLYVSLSTIAVQRVDLTPETALALARRLTGWANAQGVVTIDGAEYIG